MKKLASLAILFVLWALPGCKTATAPLPAWAPTEPIAVAGYAIASANSAVIQYEKDVAAGFVPAPALRSVMSDIQQALAVAQPIFNSWEAASRTNATAPEPPALPAAIQTITSDLAKLPSVATGGAQ